MFTRIVVDIEIGWNLYDVPGARLPVVRQVDMVLVVEKTQWNLDEDRYGTGHWKQIWALHCFINHYEHWTWSAWKPGPLWMSRIQTSWCKSAGQRGSRSRLSYRKTEKHRDCNYLDSDWSDDGENDGVDGRPGKWRGESKGPRRQGKWARWICNEPRSYRQRWNRGFSSDLDLNTRTERNDLNPC